MSACPQTSMQTEERGTNTGLGRPLGYVELGGDGPIGVLVDERQQQRIPLRFRKRLNQLPQLVRPEGAQCILLGGDSRRSLPGRPHAVAPAIPILRPDPVEGAPMAILQKEGAQPATADVEPGGRLPQTREDVLSDVVGQLGVPGEPLRQCTDLRLVPAEELGEGSDVAAAGYLSPQLLVRAPLQSLLGACTSHCVCGLVLAKNVPYRPLPP